MLEIAFWGYGFATLVYSLFALYVFVAWRGGLPGGVLLLAVLVSALWSAAEWWQVSTASAAVGLLAIVLDSLRSGAWYAFLLVLMWPLWGGRARWPLWLALSVVGAQLLSIALARVFSVDSLLLDPLLSAWLAHAIVGLMLVEQLYRSLPEASRWGIKPLCLALGAGYIFELYLFADGVLFSRLDHDVLSVRGIAHALLVPLIALAAMRSPKWTLRMAMSRQMVFHSTALAVAGLYLLVISAAAYYVRYFGGEWGRAMQLTLLFAGLVLLGALMFSGAQRARLKVLLNKHLFSYRYDYRTEWLRFTQALASADRGLDLGQSVIKALGDLVESPGGVLWLRDSFGHFRPYARLNRPETDVVESADSALCIFLAETEWVISLEEYRMRPQQYRGLTLPEWLFALPDAWLVIPLRSSDNLLGFVILSWPRTAFEINWEVLDLLKTAQRQAAGYLERMLAAEALLEARKFDSFNRMSAFVVHDLKNLVAQLSLMLKNAQRHWDKPEFQQDMLETVAHVEERMRALMIQLQEKKPIDPPRAVEIGRLLERVCASRQMQRPRPELIDHAQQRLWVNAHPERLERIIGHIVQNALDATEEDGKVVVEYAVHDEQFFHITVTDTGCGMSAEFLRERLSRPFETTKASGMGIGVFETRQYVGEIGGQLSFDSELSQGTRVTIELPYTLTERQG